MRWWTALQNSEDYTFLHSKSWNLYSAAKRYTDKQLLQATTASMAVYEFDRLLWEKSGFADVHILSVIYNNEQPPRPASTLSYSALPKKLMELEPGFKGGIQSILRIDRVSV